MRLNQLANRFANSLTQKQATNHQRKALMLKAAVATTSAALSLTAIQTERVQAATLTWDFKVNVTEGSLAGNTYSGFLSYDNSALTGVGIESVGIAKGLKISFDWFGQTYTEKSDINFPTFPTVSFKDGNLSTLNWVVNNFSSGFSIGFDQQKSLIGFAYEQSNSDEGFGNVTYSLKNTSPNPPDPTPEPTPTPEPSTVPEASPIAGLFLLGASFLLKKKAGKSRVLA